MADILNKMVSVFVGIFLLTLLFFIVFSKSGLKDLWHLHCEEQNILMENKNIERQNAVIAGRVYRLKHDLVYIEYIARHNFGMAADNELVFRFKKHSAKGSK